MKKPTPRRLLELAWLSASLLLLLFWVRSVVHARYQYPWESWLRLPWSLKLQPFELALRRQVPGSRTLDSRRVVPQMAESDLVTSLRSAADWLVFSQEPNGRFKYWYDPERDEYSPNEEDSFHRQAMASYSLVLAYEMSGDRRYLESAQKSLEYLSASLKDLAPDKSYFYAEEQADLGGAALPMLVMIELRELTGDKAYDEKLKRLANFLIFLQDKYSTGEFKSTYVYRGNEDVEKDLGWQSPISPGQAMLALARMHHDFDDPIYRNSIDKALRFYSKEKYWKQEAFLPWTISAFSSMYSDTGESAYSDYVARLADYLIDGQNLDGPEAVRGSFSSFPSITTASYLEGLGDAVCVTLKQKDSSRTKDYIDHAKLGYAWLMNLQFTSSPPRSKGGFPQSHHDPRIRIDYNAHAISAFARGLRCVFGKKPAILK